MDDFRRDNTHGYTDAELAEANRLMRFWDAAHPSDWTWEHEERRAAYRDRVLPLVERA